MSKSFLTFQLMYIIINSLYDEKPDDDLIVFLSDANPYMRQGENSVDVVLYNQFRDNFVESNENSDFYYDYVDSYLKSLDYYPKVYLRFKTLSKEEYIDNCKDIIENYSEFLKKV